MRIAFRTLSGLTLLLAAFAAQGAGKDPGFPMRPVRFVSPFAAGGNTDMVGRAIAPRLAERIGQNVIVENRPGAGGIIGTASVAKGTPDGHSLLFASGAFTSVAATAKNLPYDPLQDFSWINIVITYPFAVIVKNDSPVRSTRDLIELAKRNPGKLNYASVGVGSVFHLATELFGAMSATEMNHVPYKGGGPSLADAAAGQIPLVMNAVPAALPHVRAGRLKVLAITSAQRHPLLPGSPTFVESGVKDFVSFQWYGMLGPAGLPKNVTAVLNSSINKALGSTDVKERFTSMTFDITTGSPEDFSKLLVSEDLRWKDVLRQVKVQLD